METNEMKQFIDEFKSQWRSMWRNRLDDKMRAEGIADKDYSLLSVDRGTVIIATRKFRLLDFHELLQRSMLIGGGETTPPDPSVGGWGKFIRTALVSRSFKSQRRQRPQKPDRDDNQQLKKGGRGWLHFNK